MGKLGRILDTFCFSSSSCSCFCMNSMEFEKEFETKPLVATQTESAAQKLRVKDVVDGNNTLALQLKPKIVILRVSIHCHGCARKVEKHVSKLEGVSSYKVDLENKMVVVTGDILPLQVLDSVSKVNKYAQLWNSSPCS